MIFTPKLFMDSETSETRETPETSLDNIAQTPETEKQDERSLSDTPTTDTIAPTEPKPSYVKLAMRNMVRKRGISLQHFFLTTIALLGVLVGLAYLTR